MGKTTEQWRNIYRSKNERRKAVSKSERKFNRMMGRALSERKWNKSTNTRIGEEDLA